MPNNKQKTQLFNTFNKCIECQNIIYDMLDDILKNNERIPSCFDIRKRFTLIKKDLDQHQLDNTKNLTKKEKIKSHQQILFYDVSNDALKQTIKDTYNAFIRCFKKQAKYPRRKKYNDLHKSFYVDPLKIKFTDNKVKLEKIANSTKSNRKVLNWIKFGEKGRIPNNSKYYNPRVSFDGDHFWLTVSVDDEFGPQKKDLKDFNNKTIGIDLNINHINLSNGKEYKSINNTKKMKGLMKKEKIIQKALSRKYEIAKKEKRKLKYSKNYIKNKIKLRKILQRINNLRLQHNNEVINEIISFKPKRVVIENLDVKEMQKNKNISSLIQISGFRKFLELLKSRLRYYPIEIVEADKYFPSSKKCCCCGHIKKDLKLSDRIYKCDVCGNKISRDLNAAINLSNY